MGSEAEVADSVLDGFRRTHPQIPVRVQRVPWSAAHEKLLTAYVAGSMPDVFQLGNTWIAELAALGALERLDDRVAGSGASGESGEFREPGKSDNSDKMTREDFFPGALEPNLIDGELVSLPWYVDTRILFYRSDLLAAAGIAGAPRTWQQWRAAMQKVRASGKRYGVFLPIDEWQTPVLLALGAGASLLRDNDGRGNFQSDEVRRAFGFYASLFADDLAPRGSDAQLANLYREFAAGYFAFLVTGPWNLGEMKHRLPPELDGSWTTAPVPAPDDEDSAGSRTPGPSQVPEAGGTGASIAGGASLAVSSSSPRKDAAWQLVEYLVSPAVQAAFRERTGDLPSRRSAWDVHGQNDDDGDERVRAFRTQLDHLAATPRVPEWERIAARITLHLERVVRGDTDLDHGLADLDRDVDAILAKRRSLAGAAARRRGDGA